MTVVDPDGSVVYSNCKYSYKCMNCHSLFSSEVPPSVKKLIKG